MSRIIARMLTQAAVYWPPGAPDRSGARAFGTAIQIKVRWRDTNEEFLDSAGEMRVAQAAIRVDRDLELGGVLWFGTLVNKPDSPPLNQRIKSFQRSYSRRTSQGHILRVAMI